MKRRSLPKKQKRDWEASTLHKLTHLSLTEREMRLRLLADKASLEAKLKELFAWRNMIRKQTTNAAQQSIITHHNELIKSVSSELRTVKAQLW